MYLMETFVTVARDKRGWSCMVACSSSNPIVYKHVLLIGYDYIIMSWTDIAYAGMRAPLYWRCPFVYTVTADRLTAS